ncbi:MAG: AEC family transporter [Clostridia bacterium]|nr:AEC family transporter [Clostridia bacterium]
MAVILSSIANLLLFALIGYILTKLGKLNAEHAKILSALEVWVFLPCKMFRGFSSTFNMDYLRSKYAILISGIAILVISVSIATLLVPRFVKEKRDRPIIKYSVLISNYGYIGYAMCESVYGSAAMSDMMFAALPFSIYVYTEGYRMLTGQEKISVKRMINPIFVAIFIGCFFGITSLSLPSLPSASDAVLYASMSPVEIFLGVVNKITIDASACMAPVSMLLAGITVAEFPVKEMLSDKRVYAVAFIKMLVFPIAVILILSQFLPKSFVIPLSMLFLVPCGLNTVVFPKMCGGNYKLGASIAFVSILVSIATMPLCMKIIDLVCK